MKLADELARVESWLRAGRREEAVELLGALVRAAPPDQPWLRLIDLQKPAADEIAYLRWFVQHEEGTGDGAPPIAAQAPPITATEFADGIARVRALLADGKAEEAQKLLRRLYESAAAAQAPWLQFLVLDPPDPEELAYLEEFLRNHVRFDQGAVAAGSVASMPSRSGEIATTFMAARAMINARRRAEGKQLLYQLTRNAPHFESAWLQLLALDPPAHEEVALLETFLQHHPQHRFAQAFRARLETVKIAAMLADTPSQAQTAPEKRADHRRALSLGEYLIRQNWVAPEQIEHAVAQQQALRAEGVDQPLGTLLLMFGHVGLDRLAVAFAETSESGFGGFGDYLVRSGVLSAQQVAEAMAEQARQTIEGERAYAAAQAAYKQLGADRKRTGFLTFGRSAPVAPVRKPPPTFREVLVSMGLLTAEEIRTIQEERQRIFESLFS